MFKKFAIKVTSRFIAAPEANTQEEYVCIDNTLGTAVWKKTSIESHSELTDIGLNSHTQIDVHLQNTSNPHFVTSTQVGNSIKQWNANKLMDKPIDTSSPNNNQILLYDTSQNKWLYNNLNKVTNRIDQTSVHLANYPSANLSIIDSDLEERMLMAQDISSLVLSIRKKISIKVRQPLKKILIPILNDAMKQQLELVAPIIINEVNIKEVEYLVDSEGFIKKKLKPNFKSLGAKLGAHMKAAANLITNFTQDQILELERNQSIQITINNELITINLQDVEIIIDDIPGWSIASKGSLTVALDLTLTPELEMEGMARELVNRIQKIRKDSNFELTDRINVKIKADEKINAAINQYNDYICAEILSDDIETVTDLQEGIAIEVNEITYHVLISKN